MLKRVLAVAFFVVSSCAARAQGAPICVPQFPENPVLVTEVHAQSPAVVVVHLENAAPVGRICEDPPDYQPRAHFELVGSATFRVGYYPPNGRAVEVKVSVSADGKRAWFNANHLGVYVIEGTYLAVDPNYPDDPPQETPFSAVFRRGAIQKVKAAQ